jgi:heme/copper-type cytochrome/quinol oxidase subunit 4
MRDTSTTDTNESKRDNDLSSSRVMKLLGNRMDKIIYIRKTLFLKYAYLRQLTTNFQVSIIIASTIITFLESLNGHIPMTNSHVQITSIALSTYIAISTSVVKFLKIDDKKEEVYKLMETFSNHEKQIHIKRDKIKFMQSKCDDIADLSMNVQDEFISIYREIQDENLIEDLYESISRYDSLISYKDKLYYKGKIIENMLLERVHNNNYDYIISDNGMSETCDNDDDQRTYESNCCNNFCLYFAWLCHFCLIMKLYYFLDRKRNKENKSKKERTICKVFKLQSSQQDDIECGCCRPRNQETIESYSNEAST